MFIMEYIGETGRQQKIRMKENETDCNVDFRKKFDKNQSLNCRKISAKALSD